MLIVKKAIEVSQTANTAVIGDNTDLLVLLLYRARNIKSFDIFFHPEPKQFARKKSITVSIHSAVRKLGIKLCENKIFSLYMHCLDETQSLVYLELEKALY